jgi:hypothetical protein
MTKMNNLEITLIVLLGVISVFAVYDFINDDEFID